MTERLNIIETLFQSNCLHPMDLLKIKECYDAGSLKEKQKKCETQI